MAEQIIIQKKEKILKCTYEIRNILLLIAVVNIADLPQNAVNNLAGLLLEKIDIIEASIQQE